MNSIDVLRDSFSRVEQDVPALVHGLNSKALLWRPGAEANSIGWLVWHISRCLDQAIVPAIDIPQAWDEGWREKFNLPYGPQEGGYGQTSAQIDQFEVTDTDLLLGYFRATVERLYKALDAENDKSLGRVVDASWDPPVTAGVRFISVVNDTTQHLGQAAYIRGLWESQNA